MAALRRASDAQRRLMRAHAAEEGGRACDPACRVRRAGSRAREGALPSGLRGDIRLLPQGAKLLEEAEADALAYPGFPCVHHRLLRANNVRERANRKLKRRSRTVQVFPSRKSLVCMLGAVFAEMDEGWGARRWFAEESIAPASLSSKSLVPAAAYDGTPEEHTRRFIEVVVADNPAGGRRRK